VRPRPASRALETAVHQKARFWELRAALGLVRVGRDGVARERVGRLRAGFSEAFDLPELRAAKALASDGR
jgi:hypothetical protein